MVDREYFIPGPQWTINFYGRESVEEVERDLIRAVTEHGMTPEPLDGRHVGTVGHNRRLCVDVGRGDPEMLPPKDPGMVDLTITAMHHDLADDDPAERAAAQAISA